MDKITVLHTESSTGWGGQEIRILKESIGVQKLGARVLILCQPESMLAKKASTKGIEVRTCKMRRHYDLRAISYILRLLKHEHIDVINTHSGRDSFLAGLAGRLSQRKPLIVRTRHLALPITSRTTYCILPHRVVTTSEYVRQYLISSGVHQSRVVSIPTGVDLSEFSPDTTKGTLKNELGISSSCPLIGVISILRFKKGHHVLLDAIPKVLIKFPDAYFVFVGDGPQYKNISEKIKGLGLSEKVFMTGFRQDIPTILKSIDIFALPTIEESLSQSLMQAMAMEVPVIATNVGGIGEVVKDKITGYLIEPNNPDMLADSIIYAIQNKEESKKTGIEGSRIIRQEYSVEKMCEKMFALFSSMLSHNKYGI